MINWIIASVLISSVGIAIYHLLKEKITSVVIRRSILWVILAAGIFLPLLFGGNTQIHFSEGRVPGTVEEFCNCSMPDGKDLILFQANQAYDLVINYSNALKWLLITIGILIFVRISARQFRLSRIIKGYRGEEESYFGLEIQKIKTGNKGIGSLRIFSSYIFLDDQFEELRPLEKESVMRHEVSHLRQFNTWEIIALDVVKIIWWMNPALYYIRRELILLSEFLADEKAAQHMGSSKAYAALILRINAGIQTNEIQSIRGGSLKKRINRLVNKNQSRGYSSIIALAIILISLFSVNAISVPAIVHQVEEICIYEAMQCEFEATGQTKFCRTCTLENITE